jgi:hypothetical protein
MAVNPNATGCCGIQTSCCPNLIPQNLVATLSNSCGSFSAPLTYDPTANGGSGGWTGTLQIVCKPSTMAPCNSFNTAVSMTMYCTQSGFFMSGTLSAGASSPQQCQPFQMGSTGAISGCALQQTIVVSG